jgi:dsRNA-specific ribonuclease
LYEICTKYGWHAPVFDLVEEQGLPHIRSFVCNAHIPGTEFVKVSGKAKSNKKRAMDSASLQMLCELQKGGICLGLDFDQMPYDSL